MDVLEIIARRRSIRDYEPEAIERERLEALQAKAGQVEPLAGAPTRLQLVYEGERIDREVKGVLGDYGKVIRAPHYFVATAEESPAYLPEAGWRFEHLILEATAAGLGTCWVGGFFRERDLAAALGLPAAERVVALTPVGLPANTQGMLARAMRAVVGSADRKPVEELFFEGRYGNPLSRSIRSDLRWGRLFEAVRRAPSWANKQPWRFVVVDDEILLCKQTKQVKEGKDYHLVDCGIAMAHLHLAAQVLEFGGRWSLEPGPIPGAPEAEFVARFRPERMPVR